MQDVAVALILMACAAYVGWRLWQNLRTPATDPHCAGCPLSGNCRHKRRKHHACCH